MTDAYRSTHQCSTCPWRRAVDPQNLGEGFGHVCKSKIGNRDASGTMSLKQVDGMACHRSTEGDPFACVGWMSWAVGPGNNLGLRLRAMAGAFNPRALVLLGEQRESFDEMFDGDTP